MSCSSWLVPWVEDKGVLPHMFQREKHETVSGDHRKVFMEGRSGHSFHAYVLYLNSLPLPSKGLPPQFFRLCQSHNGSLVFRPTLTRLYFKCQQMQQSIKHTTNKRFPLQTDIWDRIENVNVDAQLNFLLSMDFPGVSG